MSVFVLVSKGWFHAPMLCRTGGQGTVACVSVASLCTWLWAHFCLAPPPTPPPPTQFSRTGLRSTPCLARARLLALRVTLSSIAFSGHHPIWSATNHKLLREVTSGGYKWLVPGDADADTTWPVSGPFSRVLTWASESLPDPQSLLLCLSAFVSDDLPLDSGYAGT